MCEEHRQNEAQKIAQPPDEAAEVVTCRGENGVVGVAVASGEIVAAHSVLLLGVPDDWLDGGAAFHLSFEGRRHAPLLPGRVDFELILGRRIVAAIAGIGVEPFDRIADELLDRRNDLGQRMAIIGGTRQRLRMGDELTALAVLEGGGNADLDAELVSFVRLALADALHLGRVQAVDLGTALSALLSAHPPRQAQQPGEFGFEPGIAVDLAGNVPGDTAEISLERAQSPVGALELLGMGVTLSGSGRTCRPACMTAVAPRPAFWRASPASHG